jgi:hypothetical protein
VPKTEFSLANSKFDDFLYEPIGDDANGVTISMFSGLSRLQLDPWRESARIAALPVDLASRAIAERIGQLNVAAWDAGESIRIAARLVKLLPLPDRQSNPSQGTSVRSLLSLGTWLVLFVAIGIMVASWLGGSSPAVEPSYGNIPGINSPLAR